MAADKPKTDKPQTQEEWWDEDAERHNRLGELAKKKGVTVGTAEKPPKLKPGGSLAEPQKE